jgi:hypothetical protein
MLKYSCWVIKFNMVLIFNMNGPHILFSFKILITCFVVIMQLTRSYFRVFEEIFWRFCNDYSLKCFLLENASK